MKFIRAVIISILFVVCVPTTILANYDSWDTVYDEDLEILAHVINGEAGSNWCSDKMMYYVGSVVLNRVADDTFPNTIKDVVFQKGQYACTKDGNYYLEPCDRAKRIAFELLTSGSMLPQEVLFQSQGVNGILYCKEQNMCFCTRYEKKN